MKIGDKVKCIKSLNDENARNVVYFTENSLYTIINIIDNFLYINTNYGFTTIFYLNNPKINKHHFNNYFISIKEERKLKLNKLNSL